MMPEHQTHQADERASHSEKRVHVNATTLVGKPAIIVPATNEQPEEPEDFTEDVFEDALDKVSRPLRGRFAHLPYSSEQFIKEKREEAELEDR